MFFQFENWKQRQISGNGVFVQAGVRKVHVDVLMKEKTANHLLHSPLEMLICPQPSQMTMSDLKTDCQTTLLPLELTLFFFRAPAAFKGANLEENYILSYKLCINLTRDIKKHMLCLKHSWVSLA